MSAQSKSVKTGNIMTKEDNHLEEDEDSSDISEPSIDEQRKSSDPGLERRSAEYEELDINGSSELHKLVKIQEDPSSLFNSLSYLVYGDISQGSLMRFFIVEHIGNNWKNFKKYAISPEGATKYSTKEEYMAEMLKSTTHGGGCELIAAGTIFPYCFEVYVDGTRYSIFGDTKKPVRRLRSSTEMENHYDAYEPNDEVSITVNKNCEKILKRKVDSPDKKQECRKVWRKKLKIEENPFATVWLVDENGAEKGGTMIKKSMCNQIGESGVQEDGSLVVGTDNKFIGLKAKRGRPKKIKVVPNFFSLKNDSKKEDEILAQEIIETDDEIEVLNKEKEAKSDNRSSWTISLKKRPVGRPRKLQNVYVPKKDKRPVGRPRKIIPLNLEIEDREVKNVENENMEDAGPSHNKNFLNYFQIRKKCKTNCPENCECSKCTKLTKNNLGKIKRKRGRPRIHPYIDNIIKRPRGRPRKDRESDEVPTLNLSSNSDVAEADFASESEPEPEEVRKKKGRRPRKVTVPEEVLNEVSEEVTEIAVPDLNSDITDDTEKVADSEEPSTSKAIPLPWPQFPKNVKKIKKKRGRPSKRKRTPEEGSEVSKLESDWYSFVEPLLSKSIIPLPLPGFTNPSDVPNRPLGRPRKSILNEQREDNDSSEKIKRPRGRPRKVLPPVEDSQRNSESEATSNINNEGKILEDSNVNLKGKSLLYQSSSFLPEPKKTVEVVKRPRGRPMKRKNRPKNSSVNLIVKESPSEESSAHLVLEQPGTNLAKRLPGRPKKRRRGRPTKIILTSATGTTLKESSGEEYSVHSVLEQPGTTLVKRRPGRPKKVISTSVTEAAEIREKPQKQSEKNNSSSPIESSETKREYVPLARKIFPENLKSNPEVTEKDAVINQENSTSEQDEYEFEDHESVSSYDSSPESADEDNSSPSEPEYKNFLEIVTNKLHPPNLHTDSEKQKKRTENFLGQKKI